jgi:5,10-methenyltetrahydromethanopterin hydrogenase
MTPGAVDPTQQREQRKQNLLLASRLARGQAVIALDELGGRADAVAYRVARVHAWLSSPLVWTAGSAVAAVVLAATLRRVRIVRVLRWSWLAWGFWRSAAPVLARYRALG